MSSEKFQSTHEQICNTGIRLLEYLQEIRAGRLSEGDDTKGLQSIENEINKALTALKEQKYQVAVIAAMKAGKSTFLNVLIGADILASETEACTVCRTDIRPIHNESTPRLLEYREGQKEPVVIAEGTAEDIRHKFLERTHKIRSTKNSDKTTRFELQHPIEAISKLSSLAGFTLVDTPGPNEWESADFSTVELKKTALEALRTCDAILFILDYSSFKDNTNSELLQQLLEQRQEALKENTGKLYFILNKVDRKAERDRPIENIIEDLKQALISFGIPDPIIYPASAFQGLLAKLISRKAATKEHKEDFKKVFLGRYIEEDEDGEMYVPKMAEAAPRALADSNITKIEESVIQTVVNNSGWNLLSDALNKLDKAAKAIEDTLNTQISGWAMELETLKQKIEIFRQYSCITQQKVEKVKRSVEEQKQILIKGFSEVIKEFAKLAKANIEEEIDKLIEDRKNKLTQKNNASTAKQLSNKGINFGRIFSDIANTVGTFVSVIMPDSALLQGAFKVSKSLLDMLTGTDLEEIPVDNNTENQNFSKIKYKDKQQAQKLIDTINNFCTPHLQSWWITNQDELIRYGTTVRKMLTQQIQNDIQEISDELSQLIGDTLQVKLNINSIQFPDFEFKGIDNLIQTHQEAIMRVRSEKRGGGFCQSESYVDVHYQDGTENVYVIDFEQIKNTINEKIDSQVKESNEALKKIIEKQIKEDFKNAEQQINDYIDRFQNTFENLLKEREMKEGEREIIHTELEEKKMKLTEYLNEFGSIRLSLYEWKPVTK